MVICGERLGSLLIMFPEMIYMYLFGTVNVCYLPVFPSSLSLLAGDIGTGYGSCCLTRCRWMMCCTCWLYRGSDSTLNIGVLVDNF